MVHIGFKPKVPKRYSTTTTKVFYCGQSDDQPHYLHLFSPISDNGSGHRTIIAAARGVVAHAVALQFQGPQLEPQHRFRIWTLCHHINTCQATPCTRADRVLIIGSSLSECSGMRSNDTLHSGSAIVKLQILTNWLIQNWRQTRIVYPWTGHQTINIARKYHQYRLLITHIPPTQKSVHPHPGSTQTTI